MTKLQLVLAPKIQNRISKLENASMHKQPLKLIHKKYRDEGWRANQGFRKFVKTED